jgi:hypothetical protein
LRNYFKVRGLNWQYEVPPTPPPFGEVFAFGGNDDQLMENVRKENDLLVAFFGTVNFHYPRAPVFIYWELDSLNFGTLLNAAAQFNWSETRLPSIYAGNATFVGMTKIEGEGSPRSTFPTSAGTDGQRLRRGRSKKAGFALNYIARLFFLTSNQAFLSLWNQLKDGRITPKIALARANAIAHAA